MDGVGSGDYDFSGQALGSEKTEVWALLVLFWADHLPCSWLTGRGCLSAANLVPCIIWKLFGANQVFAGVLDDSPAKSVSYYPRPYGTEERVIKVYYMKEAASVHNLHPTYLQ